MAKTEDLVSRLQRQAQAIADHMADAIQKTTEDLVERPWQGVKRNRDEQMRAWERVRNDPQAIRQVQQEERKTMPWLAPDRLPKKLVRDMETAEARYQRWVAGQPDDEGVA